MNISFHGAAQTVTGSKHLITLDNGKKILLDCGLFQGLGKTETEAYNASFGFNPAEINVMVLSHAHIDHTGLIPKLVKEGFVGDIFCTPATADLAKVLLEDSAIIQRDDAKYINKKREAQNLPPIQPLYTVDDVRKAAPLFKPQGYGNWFKVIDGVQAMFTDAGHIIGSASVHLNITQNGNTKHITFSGDVGRYNDMILRAPETFRQADYIVLESTYGNSLHAEEGHNAHEILLKHIQHTCIEKKGKLVIPAFSVGRTQELLYAINQLHVNKKMPVIPVFVDSPLSQEATEIIKKYPNYFNQQVQQILAVDDDPFDFPGLKFTQNANESKAINSFHQPCIIISASGMANAGRIKHHIANSINDSKNTILIVGYCEPQSLGAKLKNGNKEVRIFGEYYKVKAEVQSMRSMSAHGDYEDLLQFLKCQNQEAIKQIFLVHGEHNVQQDFKQILSNKGYKNIYIPAMHQSIQLP